MRNIILIGMPGAGKSTVGLILTKVLEMSFVDNDLVIQERTGLRMQLIIDRDGPKGFIKTEEEAVLSLRCCCLPQGTFRGDRKEAWQYLGPWDCSLCRPEPVHDV